MTKLPHMFVLRNAIAVSVVPFLMLGGGSMAADPAGSEPKVGVIPADFAKLAVAARVVRAVTQKNLPDHVLIVVELKNVVPPFGQDMLATGHRNKTGREEVFEPIRVKWFRNGELVATEVTALQRTFTVVPGRNEELGLLLRRPADGDYTLDISLSALQGTINDGLPSGFRAVSRVRVKQEGVLVVPPKEKGGDKNRAPSVDEGDETPCVNRPDHRVRFRGTL